MYTSTISKSKGTNKSSKGLYFFDDNYDNNNDGDNNDNAYSVKKVENIEETKENGYVVIKCGEGKRITLYLSLNLGLNIYHVDHFINKDDANFIFKTFEKKLIYNSADASKVFMYNRYVEIPRDQVAYGEPGTFYRFSGNNVRARDWLSDQPIEAILRKLVKKLQIFTGIKFNFALINRYRDGDKYIGYHSDDERDLEQPATIAGISFGTTRQMFFQNKDDTNIEIKVPLDHGSLIYINYPTNGFWKHSIPKMKKVKGTRISITFRRMTVPSNAPM